MWATLLALASLSFVIGVLAAGPEPTLASQPPGSPAADAPVALRRLLVAVPDPGAATPGYGGRESTDLPSRLRIADSSATVVVADPASDARSQSAPFWLAVTPGASDEAGGAPTGAPSSLDIGVAGPDGSSAPLIRVPLLTPAPGVAPGPTDTPTRGTSSVPGQTTPTAGGHVTVVEVLGGTEGIVASRVGDLVVSTDELRVPSWRLPEAGVGAVALDGAWWSLLPVGAGPLARRTDPAAADIERRAVRRLGRSPLSSMRRLVDVSVGDVTADGQPDVALAFRRPFRTTLLNASRPRRAWVDAKGLSAHVGLYRPGKLSEIWVAGTLVRPVARLAACDGALAVAYSTLRRPAIVAASAWGWHGFGFLPLPELPGAGSPTCLDIDRDGRLEAAIVERS